jgi:DNA topoisomerase-1
VPARKKASAEGVAPPANQRRRKASSQKPSAAATSAPAETAAETSPAEQAAASSRSRGKKHYLVIVESPAKAKTIQKYLGPGFEVAASYGHVRDLPPRPRGQDIGIDIEHGWKPTYVVIRDERQDKQKILDELKKRASRADLIYLAPDPDREGEAIAWHLKEALGLEDSRVRRVTFNEITRRAVQEAFQHPTTINMDLVHAQEARRFLDRVVGFKLSPLLGQKIARGLSAGRVQSVAVRLIVEREREIQKFQPEEYWKIIAHLDPASSALSATPVLRLVKKTSAAEENNNGKESSDTEVRDEAEATPVTAPGLQPEPGKTFLAELVEWAGNKFTARTEAEATQVAKALLAAPYVVRKVEQKDRLEKAPPPFITSTLQQQANIRLGFSASHTMSLAQQLYEGVELGSEGSVALITYMRTDSTRISQEALQAVRDHIAQNYGPAYLPATPNVFPSGKSAQEAHEAIRPTDLAYTPERVAPYLTDHQRKLYELIYRRFVASQMTPAVFAVTSVEVEAGQGVFKAQGKVLKFDGYRRVLAPRKSEELTLPALRLGHPLTLRELLASQHFTQPPPRYSEASLVKALEKEGIGRPSTYATIIQTIQKRGYVVLENRRFRATELGMLVTDKLIEHFPHIMDVKFTSHLEEELDDIEKRKVDWQAVLNEFWEPFRQALEVARTKMEAVRGIETGESCPRCGRPLVLRYSLKVKGNKFIGCSGWPDCDYIKPRSEAAGQAPPEPTDIKCPNCGRPMLKRQGKRGPFLGCSGYNQEPRCTTILNLDAQGNPLPLGRPTEHRCERCGSPLILREGPRGPFLGCSSYPKCRYLVEADAQGNPLQPLDTGITCEKCGRPMSVRRGPRGPFLGCSGYPECRSTRPLPAELREKLQHLWAERKKELPPVTITETCPECGAPMELRRGRRGYFLGCSTYAKTRCKGTREAPPELLEQLRSSNSGDSLAAASNPPAAEG